MATLNLPTDPRTAVWRLILARLKADPALHETIVTWLDWEGGRDDSGPLADTAAPALRLTPQIGPMTWHDELSQSGALVILLEAWLAVLDVEDLLNLQGAIERALYPDDPAEQYAFRTALLAAGAVTGLVVFHEPLSEKLKLLLGAPGFAPLGSFQLEVRRPLIR